MVKDEKIHELWIQYRSVVDERNCVQGKYENGFCYW